jgi:NTP pyrophosphatase (non-canonical NTP hydrolase)
MAKESITLNELVELVMRQAKAKGFGIKSSEIDVPEKIVLIHSEVSEAYNAYRHKQIKGKDGLEEELGDIVQRVLHLAGALDLDIETAILDKLNANKEREWEWNKLNESSHAKKGE